MKLGWYGIPGGPESKSSRTHLVEINPICGAKLGLDMVFQKCRGINVSELTYIPDDLECQNCVKLLRTIINKRRK